MMLPENVLRNLLDEELAQRVALESVDAVQKELALRLITLIGEEEECSCAQE